MTFLISVQAFAYQDLLNLIELKKTAETIREYQKVESFAELKLWFIRQRQPRIFTEFEMADKATDLGYFRADYRKASNCGKLFMLQEYFNLNQNLTER